MKKTPKLRFSEFSGEWEEVHFKDLFKEVIEKTSDIEKYCLYSLTIENGVIPKSERYEREFLVTKKEENYKVVNQNEYVYNPMNLRFGALARYTGEDPVSVSGYYNVFKTLNNYEYGFLDNFLKTNRMMYVYNTIATGSLIEKKRVHFSQFIELRVPMPSIIEQKKISLFLSILDRRIDKQQEKVKALEAYKKGIMQKIFSQEIRFKDENGQEYPEWEEVKVKNIFDITRGVVIAKSEITENITEINKYPVFSSQTSNSGILGYDSVYDFQGEFLTWTTDGANAGKVFKRSGCFRCTNVCGVLVEKNTTLGFANRMIAETLNRETPKHVSYVGNPKLMNGVMSNINIVIPVIEEQKKISKLFELIDFKIENERERLKHLKQWKKSLLQQMFI